MGKETASKNRDIRLTELPTRVGNFVMQNLPDMATIKKLALNKDEKVLVEIGSKKWELRVEDDDGLKYIWLTNQTDIEKSERYGIFTDKDFFQALGSCFGNMESRFDRPVNFEENMKALKEKSVPSFHK